jgi:hypothetical protein
MYSNRRLGLSSSSGSEGRLARIQTDGAPLHAHATGHRRPRREAAGDAPPKGSTDADDDEVSAEEAEEKEEDEFRCRRQRECDDAAAMDVKEAAQVLVDLPAGGRDALLQPEEDHRAETRQSSNDSASTPTTTSTTTSRRRVAPRQCRARPHRSRAGGAGDVRTHDHRRERRRIASIPQTRSKRLFSRSFAERTSDPTDSEEPAAVRDRGDPLHGADRGSPIGGSFQFREKVRQRQEIRRLHQVMIESGLGRAATVFDLTPAG